MRILIVEDDEFIAKALYSILSNQNYAVEIATDGQAAKELVEAFDYDLLLLDVIIPKLDGISLCKQLRHSGYQMPILLLTGRDSSHDKAIGLDAGADDYVVKPFDAEELVARIRALLRRGGTTVLPTLEKGGLRLDPTSFEVTYQTRPVQLTPKEYALLELFLRNSRRVFSCSAILDHLWSFDETPGEDAVRTHIKGLRQKLKAVGAPADLIETVYGIGYRLRTQAVTTTVTGTLEISEPTKQQTLSSIAGVWNRFKERINDQVGVLEQASSAQLQQALTKQLQGNAAQEAHTLAGSLGTFGFAEGSRLAHKIERLLQSNQCLGQDEALRFQEWVVALRHELNQSPSGAASLSQTHEDERPLLLIIDRDRQITAELVTEADTQGIRAEVTTNLSQARAAIVEQHPDVVLLDLDLTHTTEDSLTLLAELSKHTPPLPVLVFTTHDKLSDRLEVARLGGRAFLPKTVSTTQVIEAVARVLQRANTDTVKVLVVDDDPTILVTLRCLLEPWGMKITTLNDPRRFWEVLEATQPDLLILDVEMPSITGIELCQVVRNDSRWGGLPVIFLTAHAEIIPVNQVFAVGADDFVSKPIIGPELVTRILNRLERIKLLRSLAETDSLTKVANRHKSTQDLNEFIRWSQQQHQPLCFAILDLDQFKQVNDRYGHAIGDAVLRQLGQMLRQSFRSEDVVARWGGDEFIVGMYGMTKQDGQERLLKVLETLRQHDFISPEHHKFRMTFSAGVAQYPEDGTNLQSLYRSADAALYQAKIAGRNYVWQSGKF